MTENFPDERFPPLIKEERWEKTYAEPKGRRRGRTFHEVARKSFSSHKEKTPEKGGGGKKGEGVVELCQRQSRSRGGVKKPVLQSGGEIRKIEKRNY